MTSVAVCPVEELPPGEMKLVRTGTVDVGVYNIDGELLALEDRCSHDDGPLCEGDWDPEEGVVICPRHGSNFDIRTGVPLSLPAFEPVETYAVRVEDGDDHARAAVVASRRRRALSAGIGHAISVMRSAGSVSSGSLQ